MKKLLLATLILITLIGCSRSVIVTRTSDHKEYGTPKKCYHLGYGDDAENVVVFIDDKNVITEVKVTPGVYDYYAKMLDNLRKNKK